MLWLTSMPEETKTPTPCAHRFTISPIKNSVRKFVVSRSCLILHGGIARGNLTEEAEKESKITIGGEFGFAESASPREYVTLNEGLKNVLRHCEILSGEIIKIDAQRSSAARLIEASGLEEYIPSPRAGILEPTVELGADVKQGDLLGRLHDFSDHGSNPIEIRAHRSGVISNMYFPAKIAKGTTLYSIARELPG